MREIVDDDIRLDAMALDQPLALRPVDPGFGGGGDAAVGFEVAAAEPDLAAPGAYTDGLAEFEAVKTFRERFAVRRAAGRAALATCCWPAL